MLYNVYRRVGKRLILRAENVSRKQAIFVLESERPTAFARDKLLNNYTKEELENVESVRSEPEPKLDYEFTDDGQILENTDSELPGIDTDNSESSSECDN
jgi:hypothetical protein